MAIDYPALKLELATDPLVLGYAGKTAAEKAALLNIKNREVDSDREVVGWEVMNTIPLAQINAIRAHADDTVKLYWAQINQWIESGIKLKPDAPPVTKWFNYFRDVASPPITSGTRSDIKAMGHDIVSRAVELKITFGDDVTENQVIHAESKV